MSFLQGKWLISLTMCRNSFAWIVLFRMIPTFPARRDLVRCFDGDSIRFPRLGGHMIVAVPFMFA